MNLEELRSVQRAERQKDSLQHLRDSFYEDVAAYIAQLKDERERAVAAADDPFASEDVRRLTDELESTKEIANALYERRVGKVVKHASFAAADMNTDEDGMTTEERALFEDLVGRIKRSRESVLATLEGRADTAPVDDSSDAAESESDRSVEPEPDQPVEEPPHSTDDGLLADALGGGPETDPTSPDDSPQDQPAAAGGRSETPSTSDDRPHEEASAVLGDGIEDTAPASAGGASSTPSETEPGHDRESGAESEPEPRTGDAGAESEPVPRTADAGAESEPEPRTADAGAESEPDRATVRITADVGTVYGVDEREYDLAREDVVVLPTTNAEPLLQKNAAERID